MSWYLLKSNIYHIKGEGDSAYAIQWALGKSKAPCHLSDIVDELLHETSRSFILSCQKLEGVLQLSSIFDPPWHLPFTSFFLLLRLFLASCIADWYRYFVLLFFFFFILIRVTVPKKKKKGAWITFFIIGKHVWCVVLPRWKKTEMWSLHLGGYLKFKQWSS